jgi:hypothetical protein
LANGCFCFHKMKLPMPGGLSAASFNHFAWLRAHRHADTPIRRYADTAPFVVAATPRCGLLCNLFCSPFEPNVNRSLSGGLFKQPSAMPGKPNLAIDRVDGRIFEIAGKLFAI